MNIAIAGCTGRMGLALVKAVLADTGLTLAMGSERPGFDEPAARAQLAMAGCPALPLTDNPHTLAAAADVVIDFTTPVATLALTAAIAERGGIHIIGTTGISAHEQAELTGYAKTARIVQSGNFSLGVNLLEKLVEQAASLLNEAYDIEIFEMHHRHKKDAPSGTALMLGRAAASGRGVALEAKRVSAREGITGERRSGDIGFSVARGGEVVGSHSVLFAGPGEVLELKHQSFSRDIYARGALHAVRWAQRQPPGLYTMRDVVNHRL